jgi:hypothetical protein
MARKLQLPPAQADLFDECSGTPRTQRLADWGTPEDHQRARALMMNLGERWGDKYSGQESMTYDEWRERRMAVARRLFEEEDLKLAQPLITPVEERRFRVQGAA